MDERFEESVFSRESVDARCRLQNDAEAKLCIPGAKRVVAPQRREAPIHSYCKPASNPAPELRKQSQGIAPQSAFSERHDAMCDAHAALCTE
jgi:hypothetical protein